MNFTNYEYRVSKLVKNLTSAEALTIVPIIKALLPAWMENSKSGRLFTVLHQNGLMDKSSLTPFSRKNYEQLEADILECLCLDYNLNQDQPNLEGEITVIRLDKELQKVKILKSKGMLDRAFKLAGLGAKKATSIEDFLLAIKFLQIQLSLITFHNAPNEYKRIYVEIDQLEYLEKCRSIAISLLNELFMKKYFGVYENLDYFVHISAKTLKKLHEKCTSSAIEYAYFYFVKEKYEQQFKYDKALEVVMDLYDIARPSSGISSGIAVQDVMFEHARLLYLMERSDECRPYLIRCVSIYSEEHHNFQPALELNFLLDYRACRYNHAMELLESFISTPFFSSRLSDAAKGQWFYFAACSSFMLGMFRKSFQYQQFLESFRRIDVEKYLMVKLLKIITLIELASFDEADRNIGALRKYISRNRVSGQIRKIGLKYILQNLYKLSSCSYRYDEFSTKSGFRESSRKYFQQCDLHLIDFHSWFKSKSEINSISVYPSVPSDSSQNDEVFARSKR